MNIWISTSQIKSNQIKSNQIKSNQIKSNQINSNQLKSINQNNQNNQSIIQSINQPNQSTKQSVNQSNNQLNFCSSPHESMKLQMCGKVDPRKGKVDPATDRRCVFLVNAARFPWSLTCRCRRDPQSYVSRVKMRWKVTLGSPGPIFHGTFCGSKNSPQGVGPPCSGHLRGQAR